MSLRKSMCVSTVLALVAMAIFCQSGHAAPAPDDDAIAKKTFGALKQRLPKVVETWLKEATKDEESTTKAVAQVRSVRRIEATQAKVTVVFTSVDPTGKEPPRVDLVVVILLRYFDGHWTTTHSEPQPEKDKADLEIRLLMLAIDESDGD
jgi:hypothetical protein